VVLYIFIAIALNSYMNATNMSADALLCSSCAVSFKTGVQRREHMRSQWHVANVKRRVASLPAITQQDYEAQTHPNNRESTGEATQSSDSSDDGEEPDDVEDDEDAEMQFLNPTKCLFCLQIASTMEDNIAHMETSHGFQIPNIESLQEGLEPLLWYLDLVINHFYSCLYCGRSKHSGEATRAHMLDKGHCMLDMSPGSEYQEFWDASSGTDVAGPSNSHREIGHEAETGHRMLSTSEMSLGSGKLVMSRKSNIRGLRRNRTVPSKDETLVALRQRTDDAESEPAPGTMTKELQLLSPRDNMGLVGLSNAERRLVLATEKRLRSQQSRAWNARHWTVDKIATSNKRTVFKQNIAGG
jgi:pre-60S factor REI1